MGSECLVFDVGGVATDHRSRCPGLEAWHFDQGQNARLLTLLFGRIRKISRQQRRLMHFPSWPLAGTFDFHAVALKTPHLICDLFDEFCGGGAREGAAAHRRNLHL